MTPLEEKVALNVLSSSGPRISYNMLDMLRERPYTAAMLFCNDRSAEYTGS